MNPISFWDGLRWFLEVGAVCLLVGLAVALYEQYDEGKRLLDRLDYYPSEDDECLTP